MCNYGYSNVPGVLLNDEKPIKNPDAWDRYYMENLVQWWKKRQPEMDKGPEDGRMRTELEVWTSVRKSTSSVDHATQESELHLLVVPSSTTVTMSLVMKIGR